MIFLFIMLFVLAMIIYKFFALIFYVLYKIKINNLIESINKKEDLLYVCHKDFINIIAEVLKRKHYSVKLTDKCGEDQNGLILNDIQYVEALKHSLNHVVDIETAMKLARRMQLNSIYRGMLITLGDFKQMTKIFCHKNVIECINGDEILEMCKAVQKRKPILAPN